MEQTRIGFQSNLESIAHELVQLYGLEFSQDVDNLSDPLFRWLDFRLRYIDPMRRKVVASNAFPKALPRAVTNGLRHLERLFTFGMDVNPYQSKSLIRFNDSSGKKKSKRTDLLWADWGIVHLHITDVPICDSDCFSARRTSDGESWLLFCIVVGDSVGFIDVRRHNDDNLFSDQSLIRIVKESWPSFMENFKINGILPGREPHIDDELRVLRKSGISCFTTIGDEVFLGPGMGITSASTPLRVTNCASHLLRWVDQLVSLVNDPSGQFQTNLYSRGVQNPTFELRCTENGLAIFEPNANIAFTFQTSGTDENSTYFASMIDLFLPGWALQKLLGQGVDRALNEKTNPTDFKS